MNPGYWKQAGNSWLSTKQKYKDGLHLDFYGSQSWYKDGLLHRVDGPAKKSPFDVFEEWWFEGRLHRTDGPAVITPLTQAWFLNGKRHRIGGPAVLSPKSGDVEYWVNGLPEKEDGPALVRNFVQKYWFKNGELHREDGPAIEYGSKNFEWWYKGRFIMKGKTLSERSLMNFKRKRELVLISDVMEK